MKIFSLFAIGTASLATLSTVGQERKPNVLFVLLDDLGYNDVGYMGQRLIETPRIDSLARSGKIFTRHYSAAPVSAPARSGFLTGMHTAHTPIRGNDEDGARGNVWSYVEVAANPGVEGQAPMPADTRTIAHMLKDEGYTTACIGKWGLGAPGSVSEPNSMGFDFFYGSNCQRMAHDYYTPHLYRNRTKELTGNAPREMSGRIPKDADPLDENSYSEFTSGVYIPELLQKETLAFLDTAGVNNPFFLWWTTPLPHVSLAAPKRWVDYYVQKFGDEKPFLGNHYHPCRYPRATYAAMVSYIDEQVGEIIDKLKATGQYDNTIIVFTSDNGPSTEGGRDAKFFESASPYQSEAGRIKASLYEGGINVPMFVHFPSGGVKSGKSDLMTHFADWMPTFLEFCGSEQKPQSDGQSLVTILREDSEQELHQNLVWEFSERDGVAAVRSGRYKLIIKNIKSEPVYELYDLQNDIEERKNIYSVDSEIVKELKTILREAHTDPKNSKFMLPIDKVTAVN